MVHAIWSGGELATPIRRTVEDYLREVMTMIDFPDVTETQAVDFICSGCEAPYKVVRVKADARPPDRPIHCTVCKLPLPPTHGEYVLKYFLASRAKAQQAGVRPNRAAQARDAQAREMAGQEIDRLIDPSATDEERQSRKRRLLRGPKEFRDIRDKHTKSKR